MQPARLSPEQRTPDLARLADRPFDVLVVGGGITGAGTALDAASRGLSVALVEAQDWAAGTSSRSSKLIHGGLRYLEMFDFGLVHQALRERALLLRDLAPHLVRPVPILYPLHRRVVERAYVGAGIALYDALGWTTGTTRGLPVHRHLSRRAALDAAPGLRRESLVGAIEYYDAQVDDARYVLEVVRAAVACGATAVNRAMVVGFRRDGERVVGATVRDVETGAEVDVTARVTVVATGAWTEETEALAGRQRGVRVRPSKGVHLVVPKAAIDSSVALILRTEHSVLFVLPWGRHWIVGTTDTDWVHDKARPLATGADRDYLLDHLNTVLTRPVQPSEVETVFAGLRPLVAGIGVVRGPGEAGARRLDRMAPASEETTTVSREHAVGRPSPGLVVVSGGKYTTYRVMAEDAVDAAVADARFDVPASLTRRLPLPGADGHAVRWRQRRQLADRHGLSVTQVEHLLARYGGLVDEVLDLVDGDGSLAEPLPGADEYLRAEVVYAVRSEGARHLDDVLMRRTRIGIETPGGGGRVAPVVAGIMGPLLGWDAATATAEVDDYRRQLSIVDMALARATDDDAERLIKETPTLLPLP